MLTYTISITITKQQVLDFANLTGDNLKLHVEDGVVHGGLIISMLPLWSNIALDYSEFTQIPSNNVTVKMDCKFKNSLYADKQVSITFNYVPLKFQMSKITWTIYDEIEYCSGEWIICSLS